MPFTLVLDVLVAVLLFITICYAVVLNRKLGSFRREKMELERLAGTFGEATERAGDSISKLRNTAEDLQVRIDKAQALRDDLVFLIDRGGSAADRLEEIVRDARNEGENSYGPSAVKPPAGEKGGNKTEKKDDADRLRSEAERELLKALQAAR